MKRLLKGAHVVDPQCGIDGVCDVLVDGGRIARVAPSISKDDAIGDGSEDVVSLDLDGCYLVPGLVDMHVHLREPGYEYKETIATGTRAAAKGGFTGVAPMPNTKPVCDTGSQVTFLVDKAATDAIVHVYPVGSLTKGLEGTQLSEMGDMVKAGAVAFSDDGRGVQDDGMMRRAMDYAKMFHVAVLSHCQRESLVGSGQVNEGRVSTRLGMAGWPAEGEEIQIARDIMLAKLTHCHLHVQHVTTAGGVDLVRRAKAEGIPVSCEVTPHHLFLDEDDLTPLYDTNLKMNPPLRTKADREALLAGLLDGTVDVIATDHAPHAAHEKEQEFELAPFGTIGLETALPLVMTELVLPGKMGWDRLVQTMSVEPRRILGVERVAIEEGSVADITVIDPTVVWDVTADSFESMSRNSAFIGRKLVGRASYVFVEGREVLQAGKVIA